MKRGVTIVVVAICVGSAAFGLWSVWAAWQHPVEYHKRQWFMAVQSMNNTMASWPSGQRPFWMAWTRWFVRSVRDYEIMQEHEAALFKLGYLTNQDFFVTNQILTLEFSSNFFHRIRGRFGTNEQAIWRVRYEGDTHRRGFRAMLPVEHTAEWESLFRECVARYALSSIPPSAVTNSTP